MTIDVIRHGGKTSVHVIGIGGQWYRRNRGQRARLKHREKVAGIGFSGGIGVSRSRAFLRVY
jgi:hypothetical protein